MKRNKILSLGLIGASLTALAFISGCAYPEGGEGGGTSAVTLIIFLVLIFGLMYFTMIRPQRKRQKEHEQLIAEIRRGDRVITAGGIYGVVESISEDSVVIKVESGTTMRVAKGSVALKRER